MSLNRRRFLATGAAVVAGGVHTISARAARSAASDLSIGVIGTGGRGTGLANEFAKIAGVRVTHVCDADRTRAEGAAAVVEKAGGKEAKVEADLRRVFDDKTVDAVIVATCNHWHAPAAILACAAGKHVYVEKPCSHNPHEGELMVEAARKHKRQVQMGNQRRSSASIAEGVGLVRGGEIGRVYLAQSWYVNNRPPIGKHGESKPPANLDYDMWQGPAPRRPFHANYLPYNWHWFWHWGNGELGNNGIHFVDICRWGLGVDFPLGVTSTGGRFRHDDDQETPDTQAVLWEFADRKAIEWLGQSCTSAPLRQFDILFHGEKGSLGIRGGNCMLHDQRGREVRKIEGNGGDAEHIQNFLAAVRGEVKLNSDIEQGHRSTLLCHLGNIAHRLGRSIQCDPATGHIMNDKEGQAMWSRAYEPGWEPKV